MKIYFSPTMIDFTKLGNYESKRLVSILWNRFRDYIPIEVYSPCFRFLTGNLQFTDFVKLVNKSESFKEVIYRERLITSELKTVMSLF